MNRIVDSTELKELLTSSNKIVLLLKGKKGVGKSYQLHHALQELNHKYVDIDLSINKNIPLGSLIFSLQIIPLEIKINDSFFNKINNYIKNETTIIFSNYEQCDSDSRILIKSLVNYYVKHVENSIIIIEENLENEECIFDDCTIVKFNNKNEYELLNIIKNKIHAHDNILKKIVKLTNGDINKFDVILRMLQDMRGEVDENNIIILEDENIPNSFLSAYERYYSTIDEKLKIILKIIATIGGDFYEELLCKSINYINQYEIHDIAERGTCIENVNTGTSNYQEIKYKTNYRFILDEFNNIISDSRSDINKFIEKYYIHVKYLADSDSFKKYSYYDKIIILQSIINLRPRNTVYIFKYYVKLMEIYHEKYAFESVISLHNRRNEFHNGSDKNIFEDFPNYRSMVQEAFILTSRYQDAIDIGYNLENHREIFLAAKANYLNADPQKALMLLNLFDHSSCFDALNLKASIYNWFSDMEKCKYYITAAYNLAETLNEEDKKHYIIKKAGLDLGIDEFKKQSEKTIDFFRKRPKRELAEVLYNIGTIKIFSESKEEVADGLNKINESKRIFHEICDKVIWHCQNSLAIYDALNFDFQGGIAKWENIIEDSKCACFNELTVYLNITCCYIKLHEYQNTDFYLQKTRKRILEYANRNKKYEYTDLLKNYKRIVKENPEISLCIRNYFLMESLFAKQKNETEKMVRKYAKIALKSSDYNSSNSYLLERLANGKNTHKGKNYIKRFFSENEMYFCSIMFWNN